MAHNSSPEQVAKATFVVTLIGVVVYFAVVILFIW